MQQISKGSTAKIDGKYISQKSSSRVVIIRYRMSIGRSNVKLVMNLFDK